MCTGYNLKNIQIETRVAANNMSNLKIHSKLSWHILLITCHLVLRIYSVESSPIVSSISQPTNFIAKGGISHERSIRDVRSVVSDAGGDGDPISDMGTEETKESSETYLGRLFNDNRNNLFPNPSSQQQQRQGQEKQGPERIPKYYPLSPEGHFLRGDVFEQLNNYVDRDPTTNENIIMSHSVGQQERGQVLQLNALFLLLIFDLKFKKFLKA